MPVTTPPATRLALTDELLKDFEQRTDGHDRAGQFLSKDLEALREIGYYRAPVPAGYGGQGFTLPELAVLHRRIGYRSASAALAAGLHLSLAGAAADRARAGDTSTEWLLRAVADGEIIGTGQGRGEPGRDFAIQRAVPGGALPSADRIIATMHGREPAGIAFLDAVAAWSVVLAANVYLSAAQRAFDIAVEIGAGRTGQRLDGRSRTDDPLIRAGLAESVADLDAIEAHLDSAAREWTERQVADAAWNRRLLSVKQHTTRTARAVVGRSLESVGDRPARLGPVIEQLYREVAAGAQHNPTQETILRALGSPDLTSRESFAR